MKRRVFLGAAGAASLAATLAAEAAADTAGAQLRDARADEVALAADYDPTERSFSDLRSALDSGEASAASLTLAYLARIEKLDGAGPALHSVIATNPLALSIARGLDTERQAGRVRGPLHGLPILLKDNIESADPLPTTAGSLALSNAYHDADAPLVARLRAAGAVILGKANLSEWANFRSGQSVSGWSGVGGQTVNPYATRRSPSGSSSGPAVAAAASLCAGAIGTETDGSILAPSSVCGLVGIKPTVGLVSGVGIVPITPRQDTAGPMTRSVADAAALLEAIAERALDRRPTRQSLDAYRLNGVRIGVLAPPSSASAEVARAWPQWRAALVAEGAVLVDIDPPKTLSQFGEIETRVLMWEFKAAINEYLQRVRGRVEVQSLADLIAYNRAHAGDELQVFGQDLFESANPLGELTEPAYLKARQQLMRLADSAGLATLYSRYRVDVLAAPGNGPAELIDPVWGDRADSGGPVIASAAAVAGYPSLTVPAALVHGLPVGIVFVAPRDHDGTLLHVGYAFERATHARRAPTYVPG